MNNLDFIEFFIEKQNRILKDILRFPNCDFPRKFYLKTKERIDNINSEWSIELYYTQFKKDVTKEYCIIRRNIKILTKLTENNYTIKEDFYKQFILELLMWFSLSLDGEYHTGMTEPYGLPKQKFYSAQTIITKGIEE